MIADCPTYEQGARSRLKPRGTAARELKRPPESAYRLPNGKYRMMVVRGKDGQLGWLAPVAAIIGSLATAGTAVYQEREAKKRAEKAEREAKREQERADALERERIAIQQARYQAGQNAPGAPDARGIMKPGKGWMGIPKPILIGGPIVLGLLGFFMWSRKGRRRRR